MQTFGRVARQDRHFTLCDDFTMINFFIYVMNGATGHFVAGRECLFPRFEPGKFWQKGWMNVHDTASKRFKHRSVEHAHKTSEYHELDTGLA